VRVPSKHGAAGESALGQDGVSFGTAFDEDLIDAKLACRYLSVSLSSLRRMAINREFPELLHIRRGVYRIRKRELESWLQSRWTFAELDNAALRAAQIRDELLRANPRVARRPSAASK
jgi:hypothetical protein